MGKKNQGNASEQWTPEEIAEALQESGGIVTAAAARLRCSRQTIYSYIKRYKQVAAAVEDGREKTLDIAEGALLRLIRDGNVAATIFFLKTQGRGRGYSETAPVRTSDAELDWMSALDTFKL